MTLTSFCLSMTLTSCCPSMTLTSCCLSMTLTSCCLSMTLPEQPFSSNPLHMPFPPLTWPHLDHCRAAFPPPPPRVASMMTQLAVAGLLLAHQAGVCGCSCVCVCGGVRLEGGAP